MRQQSGQNPVPKRPCIGKLPPMQGRWARPFSMLTLSSASTALWAQSAPDARTALEAIAPPVSTDTPRAPLRPPATTRTGSTNLAIHWGRKPNSVDARVIRQPLSKVLPALARATGWKVFVEPGVEGVVTSSFKGLPSNEALDRILHGFNHAVVTSTNGQRRLLVFHSNPSGATAAVAAADDLRVENEIVAVLQPGSGWSAADLARKTGGEVAGTLDALNAARLRYADADAANKARDTLKAMDGVSLEDNRRFLNTDSAETDDTGSTPRPLRITPASTGNGKLVIGLVDTGVQVLDPSHEAFILSRDSVVGGASADPALAHGTTMFSNLMKSAEATAGKGGQVNFGVVSVDVYGANDNTTAFDVALGIQKAIERKANVINLSLSGDTDAPYLRQMISAYRQQGVLFLAAAGNEPVADPRFPAAYPEVIAVTAGNAQGQYAPYANHGAFVDLMLPGSGVVSYHGDLWRVNGTSTATAYASGAAGALWNPSIGSPANLEPILRKQFGVGP